MSERDRDKRHRDYPSERDGRDRDHERHRERAKDRHRSSKRSRSRSRDKHRSSDHASRDKDRDRDRHRDRDREGDRDHKERHREREHRDKGSSEKPSRDKEHRDHDSRKRSREPDPTPEDQEAAAQKQKLDEQAALEAEMEKRRKRVEEWRRQRQLQQQQEEAAAAAAAAATAADQEAAAAAATAGKMWSLEDEGDDGEDHQEQPADADEDRKDSSQMQQDTQEQQKQEEDDEPDPLDAFMAGNAATLEVEATQQAAEDAAAASQQAAAGGAQQQQQQQQQQEEEEVDPLDAYMQEAVLPDMARPSTEPATASAGAGAASQKSTGSADRVSTAAAGTGKPPTAVAPARFISSKSMLFVRPAGAAAAAAARPGAAGRAAKAKRRRNLYSSSDDESDSDGSDADGDASDDEEWARNVAAGKGSKMDKLTNVDHSTIDYIPFRKGFYIEALDITRMTDAEVDELRKELDGLKVRGLNCPRPIKTWTQAGLSQKVLDVLVKSDLQRPLPIQAQALPIVMSGRDCIGIAKTGSGKTLAFVLPLLRHVKDQPPLAHGDGPIALIMAPTRELVVQIAKEIKRFAKFLDLAVVPVFGGSGVANQISELKRGAEVVAATPGRLIDLLVTGAGKIINLRRVTFLVIDEADRMFDMGFEPQIMRVVNNIRPDRQTVMFSATFPRSVETLARQALKDPVEIQVGGRSVVNADIEQFVEIRPEADRFLRLLEVLGEWFERGKIIIFVHSQDKCDNLFRDLLKAGYPCLSLHGGKDQSDRESTIADFKSNVCNILVATSVAARGLDVKELVLVVNYDVPNHHEDYVHRVGRTGRAGNKGTAITFIGPDEEKYAPDLVKALKESKAVIPQDLQEMANTHNEKRKQGLVQGHGSGYGGSGFKFDKDEDQKVKAARRQKAKEFGIIEADDHEEAGSSSDDDIRPAGANAAATAAAAAAASAPAATNGLPSAAVPAGAPASAPSAPLAVPKFLPAQPGQVFPGQAVTQDGNSILAAARQAAEAAAAKVGGGAAPSVLIAAAQQAAQRAAELAARMTGAPIPTSGVGGGSASTSLMATAAASASAGLGLTITPSQSQRSSGFEVELEINDFPQQARYRVTHKGFQNEITELTGAAVTTKGIYVKSGNAPEGERKLYLLIEGPTEQAVRRAKQELKKTIEEITEKAMRRDVGAAGRYQI